MTCANDCNRETHRHTGTHSNGQAPGYTRNLADFPKNQLAVNRSNASANVLPDKLTNEREKMEKGKKN